MAETPTDPWKDVKAFRANAASTVGLRVYDADDVDRALAAERAQCQQKTAALNRQVIALEAEVSEAFKHAVEQNKEIAQQAETIRQLQAQIDEHDDIVEALGEGATRLQQRIATLTQERDEASERARDHHAMRMFFVEKAEAAEARCATLTAALEEARRHLEGLGWWRSGGTSLKSRIDVALGAD